MLPYIYLAKICICSAIFLLYYYLVLRNNVYHQYNRFYLLFTAALSWCIPLINFQILIEPKQVVQPIYTVVEFLTIVTPTESTIIKSIEVPAITKQPLDTDAIIYYAFITITCIFFLHFLMGLIGILRLKQKHQKHIIGNIALYYTEQTNTPFSFFKNIFWNKEIDMKSAVGKQILAHELVHINQLHSIDKIAMQLNLIAGWFNPFFWVINKELSLIHEFIADKKSIPDANLTIFAQMMLGSSFAGKSPAFTNPFFLSPINRRLIMLSKNTLPRLSYAQRIIALPLLTLTVLAFSLKAQGYNLKQVANNVVTNLSNQENASDKMSSLNEPSPNLMIVKNAVATKDTVKTKENKSTSPNTEASIEEMNEYKKYERLALTNSSEKDKKFDVSKLNATQKLRMQELYTKMSTKQKLELELHTTNFALKFIQNKPTNALIAEWKKNSSYTFSIDNSEVDKESIKDANDYIGYYKMYTTYNPTDESMNKAIINFTTKERLESVNKAQRFYWLKTVEEKTTPNEATKEELNEVMILVHKYDPMEVGENLTGAERERLKALYNKMSSAQKAKSPVWFKPGDDSKGTAIFMSVDMGKSF